jgi:hypothetical protein
MDMATVEDHVETWVWPPDVLQLAKEKGVSQYLEPMLEMTRRLFANAIKISVLVEEDWEIADWRVITFAVQVRDLDPDEYVRFCHDWDKEGIRICPPAQINIFGIWLECVGA